MRAANHFIPSVKVVYDAEEQRGVKLLHSSYAAILADNTKQCKRLLQAVEEQRKSLWQAVEEQRKSLWQAVEEQCKSLLQAVW